MDIDWDSAYTVEGWIVFVGFIAGLFIFFIQNRNPRCWIIVYWIFFLISRIYHTQTKNEVEILLCFGFELGMNLSLESPND